MKLRSLTARPSTEIDARQPIFDQAIFLRQMSVLTLAERVKTPSCRILTTFIARQRAGLAQMHFMIELF
jgi:hypothetical protein